MRKKGIGPFNRPIVVICRSDMKFFFKFFRENHDIGSGQCGTWEYVDTQSFTNHPCRRAEEQIEAELGSWVHSFHERGYEVYLRVTPEPDCPKNWRISVPDCTSTCKYSPHGCELHEPTNHAKDTLFAGDCTQNCTQGLSDECEKGE